MASFYLFSALVGTTLMIHLAINALLDFPRQTVARAFVGFLLGGAAYLLLHSLAGMAVPRFVILALFLLNESVPWCLWIFARSVCIEGASRIGWRWWLLAVVLVPDIWIFTTGDFEGWLHRISDLIKLLTCMAAVWVLMREPNDDLVDARRRIRRILVWFAAVVTLLVLLMERTPLYGLYYSLFGLLLRLLILGLVLAFSIGYFRLQGDVLAAIIGARPTSKPPAHPPAKTTSDLAQRVITAMTVDRLYRQNGLTIRALSEQLKQPEYRLRRAINIELGYRNFSTFLNFYRLQEAADALRDPQKRHLPILTIALEVGFNSLAPFNRAFKARYGQTPSEYRQGQEPEASIEASKP